MRLLLINANTTEAVTRLCAGVARGVASAGTEIVPLTGRFGAAIIESRAENAIAAHALLELVAEHRSNADAALIAVSYDTGLLAARDIAGIPVLGITQASLSVACLLGSRIGMVTFGTPGLYRELAEGYGCGSRIVGIEVIATDARAAYADPGQVEDIVAAGALKLVKAGADVVVLCGAALSGMAAAIEGRVPAPVLDGVTCGVPLCEMLARQNKSGRPLAPRDAGSTGLSPALRAALYR